MHIYKQDVFIILDFKCTIANRNCIEICLLLLQKLVEDIFDLNGVHK